eukprot:scaffold1676_cov373-Prasinococcus_capsulatus_cf.AAC.3
MAAPRACDGHAVAELDGVSGRWWPQFDTFMGLGVTVTEDVNTREKTIVNVAPTGPASAAGVVRGMKLLAVDGRPATKLSLSSVRDALGGEEGTSVALKGTDPGCTSAPTRTRAELLTWLTAMCAAVQFEADAPTDIDVERQQYSVRRQVCALPVALWYAPDYGHDPIRAGGANSSRECQRSVLGRGRPGTACSALHRGAGHEGRRQTPPDCPCRCGIRGARKAGDTTRLPAVRAGCGGPSPCVDQRLLAC